MPLQRPRDGILAVLATAGHPMPTAMLADRVEGAESFVDEMEREGLIAATPSGWLPAPRP